MAARGTFEIAHPDGVEMTLTITMSVGEWKIIKERLKAGQTNGEWTLDSTIRSMIDRANKEFNFYQSSVTEQQ